MSYSIPLSLPAILINPKSKSKPILNSRDRDRERPLKEVPVLVGGRRRIQRMQNG